ncbi:Ran-binding-domain-containing protein [Trichoderma citrinoviride]|uniref:Ran-binding-domain-containing protein n=1 Tax=Trichoderma citrinoviride TaxID=58853 RepID=A0A2T4BIM3_9HYPO|nr:Ran-binding-domain-containing protein [Trichoderma citrinoviride]PTB69121.1 Ran-binding-domain-containing protein [Trichoderma citrinoviride]
MDDFLAAVGVQAMRYAIRSGIALTSSYAISQCSRLLKAVDDKSLHAELRTLQKHLDSKIKVISPAIDLVEFKSGRGNVFLESALPLAKSLHQQIVSLGRRVEAAAAVEEHSHRSGVSPPTAAASHEALKKVIQDLKDLLGEIDRDIPLLQLAISASGESLSTSLPAGISPSRLLQASTLLIVGDTQFAQDPSRSVQIGPSFTLSVYMLFLGHASVSSAPQDGQMQPGAGSKHQQTLSKSADAKTQRPAYGLGVQDRKPLWQEAIHKARVRLCRSACSPAIEGIPSNGDTHSKVEPDGPLKYAYHLELVEDLDDGRAHEGDASSQPFNGVAKAGIRELIPIHQLSKIFYTDTGRILNVGDGTEGENNPVLLLKRDINAPRLRRPEYDMLGEMHRAASDPTQQEANEDEQADVDRQLFGESSGSKVAGDSCDTCLPKHLDPEWIAFEVFEEDDDERSDASSNAGPDTESSDETQERGNSPAKSPSRLRAAMDSSLVSQIKNLSVQPTSRSDLTLSNSDCKLDRPSRALAKDSAREAQDFVSRSPFGAITTSLSLIEMLIRLAGLQEFQQASHLSIPDHILTFFLEETSTTGLTGEAMWKARSETKQRVGFDPYTDTA